MTDQTQTAIEAIRELAPKLNATTDEAAETIRLVNDFLAEASIGLPCEVVAESEGIFLNDDDEGDNLENAAKATVYTSLAYDRLCGDYCILVRIERVHGDADDWESATYSKVIFEKAWQSCPRDLKLKTFEKLPELLEVIAEKAKASINSMSTTSATVKKITEALNAPPLEFP